MNLNPGNDIAGRPRFVPHRSLPSYSYVPGHAPHPVSHPDGHMYGGGGPAEARPLDPARWQDCEDYLYGLDLFNHGYYWEAHETWEALWHAAGRSGPMGDFLKGLIKLAAACVKAREGSAAGAARHARRCVELLRGVAQAESGEGPEPREGDYYDRWYAGLDLRQVGKSAEAIAAQRGDQPRPLEVYDAVLLPRTVP